MEWYGDSYTILAGDAAASFAGRGLNLETRKWETISGKNLGRSKDTRYVLRVFQIWIYKVTTFTLKQGVVGTLYVVGDPLATNYATRLLGEEMQGGMKCIRFVGRIPLNAGCLWRVNYGGLDAGDRVDASVGYEYE